MSKNFALASKKNLLVELPYFFLQALQLEKCFKEIWVWCKSQPPDSVSFRLRCHHVGQYWGGVGKEEQDESDLGSIAVSIFVDIYWLSWQILSQRNILLDSNVPITTIILWQGPCLESVARLDLPESMGFGQRNMAGKKLSLVDKGILQILLCCREERGHTRQIDTLFLGKNPSKILHFRVHFYAILSPINKLSVGKKIFPQRGVGWNPPTA